MVVVSFFKVVHGQKERKKTTVKISSSTATEEQDYYRTMSSTNPNANDINGNGVDNVHPTRMTPKRMLSDIPEPKTRSGLGGVISNLVNSIVGAGIIGTLTLFQCYLYGGGKFETHTPVLCCTLASHLAARVSFFVCECVFFCRYSVRFPRSWIDYWSGSFGPGGLYDRYDKHAHIYIMYHSILSGVFCMDDLDLGHSLPQIPCTP